MKAARNLSFYQSIVVLMEVCFHREIIIDGFITVCGAITVIIRKHGDLRALCNPNKTMACKQPHRFM